MAFFRPRYNTAPEPNFQGLFRLIDDFDRYSSLNGGNGQRQSRIPTFTPKFDMRESETAYELHGELPGIAKEDVHIEFTDPQTLLVRGKVERTYKAGTPPAGLLDNKSDEMSGAITEHGEHQADDAILIDHPDNASLKSHQATVEDDAEEGPATSTQPMPTPATTAAEVAKVPEQQPQQQKIPAPVHKYFLVERNVGQFSRSFNFPSRIDNESVTASLDNGILTVVIQKAKKHESRRININ